MPRETVLIDVSCPFPFVAGAALLAKLAYPEERILCNKFMWALCRWRVLDRVHKEPHLAAIPQPIIPAAFTAPHGDFWSTMKKGQRKLFQRMIAANWIILPHLEAIHTEKMQDVEGRYPSVNWLSELAIEHLGWKGKKTSVPTFKSKVWATTRSVSHAVAAYLYFNQLWCDKKGRDPSLSVEFLQLCLDAPSLVSQIVNKSEELRLDISRIEQFERPIKEEELVHFVIYSEGDALTETPASEEVHQNV